MSAIDTAGLSELLPDELTLLMSIGDQEHPVGARIALRMLEENGVRISEASVSRMLARLDALGFTRAIGRKGRVLTTTGREAFELRRLQARRDETFDRAFELRSVSELLDWLRARRVIEGEAAYLAALRRDDDHMSALASEVVAHEDAARTGALGYRTVGMQMHLLVARAAQSPMFEALIESMTAPAVERVEDALDLITSSRGTLADSAAEHRRLYEAIRNGDADAARERMHEHLARLEQEVEQYALASDGAGLLTALSTLRVLGPRSAER
ncbi:FCD domain-containing protein [Zhihengliuella sp. ISTPL4]|uniref:FCD domain-containing protein n=1 Tax=Zhihengliuella sp. ISTPL4 TaxID=2058657 RepID=UPI00130510A4|nr:FCD domain-containing protein [Zhihengliuella sp. ISTPL4]